MCDLTIIQHNPNDAEENRSNVTASSIITEENRENNNDHTTVVSLAEESNRRRDDPLPPHLEFQEEILLIKLREAVDKCQATIRQQRYALRGFHELAEDVDRLRRNYEIINAENQMWKADLERERWMHKKHMGMMMRHNSAPPERQRRKGSFMLRDLVKNLSMRL